MSKELFEVPVEGGSLRVARWPGDGPTVVAAHGLTATHMEWPAVAHELGGRVDLIAPDLRGRGGSNGITGPFGMAAHAADIIAVLDHVGAEQCTIVGHSMGGFVASVLATHHAERVSSVIWIDGGPPIPAPPGDIDEILAAIVGPSVARLSMTFESLDAYHDFWKQHPSVGGRHWGPLVQDYVDYDLVGEPPALRSGVSLEAVREDSRDTLIDNGAVYRIFDVKQPARLLRAERGMLDTPEPLLPDALVDPVKAALPQLVDEVVPDTNHFTIVLGTGAPTVAARILESAGAN